METCGNSKRLYNIEYPKDVLLKDIFLVLSILDDNIEESLMFEDNKLLPIFSKHILSCAGSIRVIDYCIDNLCLVDGFVICRRYRDTFLQYFYLKSFNENEVVKKWIKYKDVCCADYRYNKLDHKHYMQHLINNEIVKMLFEKYFNYRFRAGNLRSEQDIILDDYVHLNGMQILNSGVVLDNENIERTLKDLARYYTNMLLSIIIIMEAEQIRSSDYLDALEMGFNPKEGSQYYVAPQINKYINTYMSKELKKFLIENSSCNMLIK
jgi:hypothetical protein